MILRRILAHFRKQEWTAIALDFVIVVMGVFVGIQVSNWNAARELRTSEMSHATQLRDEIVTNVRLLEAQMYTRELVEAGRRALLFLENEEPCADRCRSSLTSFTRRTSGERLSARTVRRECADRTLPDEAVRAQGRAVHLNLAGWNPINLTAPAFRTEVRGYLSPAARSSWGDCFDVPDDQLERLSRDCIGDLDRRMPRRCSARSVRTPSCANCGSGSGRTYSPLTSFRTR
jgi:hypothetical protein